jgi:hypothetical protein
MAVSRVKTSSILQGFPKSRSLLAGNAGYDPAATFLIQRVAGTGSSGTITFSSIPQTYKHLQIRVMAKSSYTGGTGPAPWQVIVRPNADSSSANYTFHQLRGNGTAASASGAGSGSYDGVYVTAAGTSNYSGYSDIYGVGIIDIHNYTSSTQNKTIRAISGVNNNLTTTGSQSISLNSGVWLNTAAITSITLFEGSSYNWLTGSTFALYGMVG